MIGIGTIGAYLVGSRAAILEIARSRAALPVGGLLVLSGGLARNYDGAYLLAEWSVLLHGPVVSVANSFLLFVLFFAASRGGPVGVPFWRGWLAFLGLFWMSAPMAWLYGIPYERFLDPVDAVSANLWTLALVSVWRVALTTRVLSVILGVPARRAFWLVMFFADAVAVAALLFSPMPLIDFMGGLQQSPEDLRLAGMTMLAAFVAVVTGPVWIIGALIAATGLRIRWAVAPAEEVAAARSWRPVVAAACCLVAWLGAVAWAQPEQRNRFVTEAMLTSGRIEAALDEMSRYERSDYPPIWDPPPRLTWRENEPPIDEIRRALVRRRAAPWVEELLWTKCWNGLSATVRDWHWISLEALEHEGLRSAPTESFEEILRHAGHDPRLTDEWREALRTAVEAERQRREGL